MIDKTDKIDRVQFRAGPVARQLAQRVAADHDLSPDLVARRDLLRYYTLLLNDIRGVDLTRSEAMLCCEALSGPLGGPDDIGRSPAAVYASIIDAMRLDRLDEKWEVDQAILTEKVAGWTAGQRYAVADAVERWWLLTTDDGAGETDDQALGEVGLLRT
jgi:hypothetical protein